MRTAYGDFNLFGVNQRLGRGVLVTERGWDWAEDIGCEVRRCGLKAATAERKVMVRYTWSFAVEVCRSRRTFEMTAG
jgi:hypothetical protein